MQGHYRTPLCLRRSLLNRLIRQLIAKSCLQLIQLTLEIQLTPKTLQTRRQAELRALPRETARCVSSKTKCYLLCLVVNFA